MGSLRHWLLTRAGLLCHAFWLDRPALALLGAVLDEDPDYTPALGGALVIHAGAGRRAEAFALGERLARLKPDDAAAQFNHGFFLQERGRHDEAMSAFDRALALDASVDRAWYGKALSLIALGRLREAIEPLERTTKLQPFSPYGWYQLARVHHDLGEGGRTAKIIRHLHTFEPKFAQQLERETGIRARPGEE